MDKTRLSIIVPSFNSSKTIRNTLDSIVRQKFDELEIWVIDGQSTDDTVNIVRSYAEQHKYIHFLSEPDDGIYDAMNKGITVSKGDYLYFMGSDDIFFNDSVLTDLFAQPAITQCDFIYGDVVFRHSRIRMGSERTYLGLIKNLDNINHQAIFYSRKVFETIGVYDLRYKVYADFNLNIKCFKDSSLLKKYVPLSICLFNEKGFSHFNRSKDNYIQQVHEMYVAQNEDPAAMYDTAKFAESQATKILNSRDYIIGKKIGNVIRSLRRISGFNH